MAQAVIVVDERDNVATALRPLRRGESVEAQAGGRMETVIAQQYIPFGHKIALANVGEGEAVVKYGEAIGVATQRITKGDHVHIHNVQGPQGEGRPE
jgi:altronate dehydratase small subunit